MRIAPSTGLREVRIELPGRPHSDVIGPGALERLPQVLGRLSPSRVALVSDRRVGALWADRVTHLAEAAGYDCPLILLPPGERAKSRQSLFRLLAQMEALRLDRSSVLLALGGGTVGDVTGLAASIWQRGIRLLQLPTTLLAMVDSALGGKTAINSERAKNSIGTFWQPAAVVSDLDLLATLPEGQYLAAFGEIVKYAMAMDAPLAARLRDSARRLRVREPGALSEVVARCAELKAEVVAADETDQGRRAVLNYGHTIAHGLEAASSYRAAHGRAVAMGMRGALRLSIATGRCDKSLFPLQEELLRAFSLPGALPQVEVGAVLEAMSRDKKASYGELKWVLLTGLGEAQVGCPVDPHLVREVVSSLLG